MDCYYKVRQVLQSAMDLSDLLQSVMIITNCDSTTTNDNVGSFRIGSEEI